MGNPAKSTQNSGNFRTSKQAWLKDAQFTFPQTDTYLGIDNNGSYALAEDMFELGVPEFKGKDSLSYKKVIHQELHCISKRIELATLATVSYPFSAEPYQVANYGLGGEYASHLDPAGYLEPDVKLRHKDGPYDVNKGDRFATFMGYLSSVPLGGGTVFPVLGLRAHAHQGDAVFWINLFPSGRNDFLTNHGGCPVLVGSKWITNKWIGAFDQMFHNYPCRLDPTERYQTFREWR